MPDIVEPPSFADLGLPPFDARTLAELEFCLDRDAVEQQTVLGRRSFYDFFQMAWRYIDNSPYLDNWHIKLMCNELQRCARKEPEHLRTVFCVPPRSLKSQMISVAFPAWVWTYWPGCKFITAAYDIKLSARDAVVSRRLIKSDWYQRRWPIEIHDDQDGKILFSNTAGGHRMSTSTTAGVTGHGADIIAFDDPHNLAQAESQADRDAASRFAFESLPSRLNDQRNGVIIITQQRVHTRDVAGEAIRRGYHTVVLPQLYESDHPQAHPKDPRLDGEPLQPRRLPQATAIKMERAFGAYVWGSQQQQRPVPREGGLFKTHFFRIIPFAPASLRKLNRAWDWAATEKSAASPDPDWTVGLKNGLTAEGQVCVTHVWRDRVSAGRVKTMVKQLAGLDGRRCRVNMPQDPAQAGKVQRVDYGVLLRGFPTKFTVTSGKGDKVTRADPIISEAENNGILLVEGDWNEAFIEELTSFPTGAHDDQVDALTLGYENLIGGNTGLVEHLRETMDQDALASAGTLTEDVAPARVITVDYRNEAERQRYVRETGQAPPVNRSRTSFPD